MIPSARLARLLCALILVLGLAACGGDTTGSTDASGGDPHAAASGDDAHDHEQGPHGGAIAVVGDHVAHLEALHDENAGQVTMYLLAEDDSALTPDQPPVLNLVTADGSVQVKGEAIGDAWFFENDALIEHPEKARFRLVIRGKTYQPDLPCSHDDAAHGDHGAHGPHDGVMTTFADGAGHLELKLHDDKGDLELWLYRDAEGGKPYDVPTSAELSVTFVDKDGKRVALAVRDLEQNEDEDGVANLREGETNYFIFPGETGADASWLMGADFFSKVTVRIETKGKTFTTQPFDLRPHTHGAGAHDH